MRSHTGLLTPRCRYEGWAAQSTMVKTQNAVSTRATISSTLVTIPILGVRAPGLAGS